MKISEDKNLWGIDLGGTKIEGAILESELNPEVLFRFRVPTEAHLGYKHILGQVKKMVDLMESKAGYRPGRLGIGTPGTHIPSTGLMKNSNATALNGRPMKTDLEDTLKMQVEIANDANCFALAETKSGVVKEKFPDAQVVFGIILGTGVGGGIVVNGKIINGHHGIGGEWGHNELPGFEGRKCFCGKTGDNESILSGTSLEWFYEKESGVRKSLKEIVTLSRSGTDKVAKKTINRLTRGFAKAVSVMVNTIDPDVIVIGGGVGNIDEIYTDGVKTISEYVFNNEFRAEVVKPLLGDSAGVFGAAFLTANAKTKRSLTLDVN